MVGPAEPGRVVVEAVRSDMHMRVGTRTAPESERLGIHRRSACLVPRLLCTEGEAGQIGIPAQRPGLIAVRERSSGGVTRASGVGRDGDIPSPRLGGRVMIDRFFWPLRTSRPDHRPTGVPPPLPGLTRRRPGGGIRSRLIQGHGLAVGAQHLGCTLRPEGVLNCQWHNGHSREASC